MALEWNERLSVGVREIDDQHKELFNRVNLLLEAMMKRQGKEEVGKTIKFLESYVVSHFGTEERYMVKHSYPEYIKHKGEHGAFIATFNEIKKRYSEVGASPDIVISTQHKLGDWLKNHIPFTDKSFANFLKTRQAA